MDWIPNRSLNFKQRPTQNAEMPCLILEEPHSDPRSSKWRLNGKSCRVAYKDEGHQSVDVILSETAPKMGDLASLRTERKRIKRYLKERKSVVWKAAWRDATEANTYTKRIVSGSERYTVTIRKPFTVKTKITRYRTVLIKHGKMRVFVRQPYTAYVYRRHYKVVTYERSRPKFTFVKRTNWKQVVYAAKVALMRDQVIQQLQEAYLDAIKLETKCRNELVGTPNHCRATRNADSQLFEPKDSTETLTVYGSERSIPSKYLGIRDLGYLVFPGIRNAITHFRWPVDTKRHDYENDKGSTTKTYPIADMGIGISSDLEQHWGLVTQRALNMRTGRVDILDDAFVAVRSLCELRDLPKTYTSLRDFFTWLAKAFRGGKLRAFSTLAQAASLYLAYKFGIEPTAQDVGLLVVESADYALKAHRSLQKLVESLVSGPKNKVWVHLRQRVGGRIPEHIQAELSAPPWSNQGVSFEFRNVEALDGKSYRFGSWLAYEQLGGLTGRLLDDNGEWAFDAEDGKITPCDGEESVEDYLVSRANLCRLLHTTNYYQSIVFAKAELERALHFGWDTSITSWLDWAQPLKTSWELFPLSFITDWFLTTNQVAQAVQNLASLKIGDALVDEVWHSTRSIIYAALEIPTLTFTSSFERKPWTDDIPETAPDGTVLRYHPYWKYYHDIAVAGEYTRSVDVSVGLTITSQRPHRLDKTQIMRYERGRITDYSSATLPRVRLSINRGKLLSLAAVVTSMVTGVNRSSTSKQALRNREAQRAYKAFMELWN